MSADSRWPCSRYSSAIVSVTNAGPVAGSAVSAAADSAPELSYKGSNDSSLNASSLIDGAADTPSNASSDGISIPDRSGTDSGVGADAGAAPTSKNESAASRSPPRGGVSRPTIEPASNDSRPSSTGPLAAWSAPESVPSWRPSLMSVAISMSGSGSPAAVDSMAGGSSSSIRSSGESRT